MFINRLGEGFLFLDMQQMHGESRGCSRHSMGLTTARYAILLCLLVFSCLQSGQLRHCHGAPTINCREDERKALLQFKAGLVDNHGLLSSWAGQDCCSWPGVMCSNNTGHVVKLHLPTPGYGMIQGGNEINPGLLVLRHLSYLDLSWISFKGAPIPEFIGSFDRLRYLNLSKAGLVGTVPAELGNLSSLRYLDLSWNYNMSAFPYVTLDHMHGLKIENDSWLSRLSSLRYLDLSYVIIENGSSALQSLGMLPLLSELHLFNALTSVPGALLPRDTFTSLHVLDLSNNGLNTTLPPWLFEIGSLKHLDLSLNSFTGGVPNLNLTSIEFLDLSNNQLNGTLPESLGQLSNLVELDLHENSLDGVLTEAHFRNLRSLKKLNLVDNLLTIDIRHEWNPPWKLTELRVDNCKVGPAFPAWLRRMENISSISMSRSQVSDVVPDWFWNFSFNISSINLSNNKLKGKLPASLRHLQHLVSLDLSNNQLEGPFPVFSAELQVLKLSNNSISGPIPPNINEMTSTMYLFLSANKLNGSIPSTICKLKGLAILDLSDNHLSGEIPDCWDNNNILQLIDLSNNEFSGNVPASVCSGSRLESLSLESNVLSGGLPLALQNCTNLVVLDLGNNELNGSIPTWLGKNLTSLTILRLHSNMFHGKVPSELGHLSFLGVVDLSHNMLSGTIPESFANFSLMKHSHNGVDVRIRGVINALTKGRDEEYSGIILMPTSIDLSSNNLSGGIPEALTALDGLQNLNLSRNHLTGTIPWSISGLQSLESLDLSFNNLTGEIPPAMSVLNFLGVMNFSFNDLSGRIPTGGQFDNHPDPSIYVGNDHLCGFPLNSICGSTIYQPSENTNNDEEDDDEEVWFYVSAILGFVVGVWTLVGALLLKRKWRIAYFRFIDHSYDKLHVFVVLKLAKIRRI